MVSTHRPRRVNVRRGGVHSGEEKLRVIGRRGYLSRDRGNLVENAPWLAWRSNALYAGGTEQIPAKARMADCAVADDIDESGLAGPQRTF